MKIGFYYLGLGKYGESGDKLVLPLLHCSELGTHTKEQQHMVWYLLFVVMFYYDFI